MKNRGGMEEYNIGGSEVLQRGGKDEINLAGLEKLLLGDLAPSTSDAVKT